MKFLHYFARMYTPLIIAFIVMMLTLQFLSMVHQSILKAKVEAMEDRLYHKYMLLSDQEQADIYDKQMNDIYFTP